MSVTANYGWAKPDPGASNDVWGDMLNSDLDGIDGIVSSVSAVANAALSVLPVASTTVLGGVKVDGSTITIAGGVISSVGGGPGGGIPEAPTGSGVAYARRNSAWSTLTHADLTDWAAATAAFSYSLPTASTTVLGGVKVDGTTVTIAAGVISSAGGGGAAPSSTTPIMDGTAAIGVGTTYARADHVHPSDTTRYAATNPSGYQTAAQVTAALPPAASTTPVMDGTGAVGASTAYARQDHVHPTDTSRAPLAGPTFTGTVTLPTTTVAVTQAANNNTTAPATTAFVIGQAATVAPVMDGTATVGASLLYARQDHVHPTDTSRAPVASPTFTGTVTIPTGAAIATPNITGVVTVSNAAVGQVGEWLSAQQLTAQSMTSTTAMNVIAGGLSLSAGDWDVDGDVYIISSAGVGQNMGASLSLTSATMAAVGTPGRAQVAVTATLNLAVGNLATGRLRVNVSTTTTVYLVAVATFASGTCTAQGTIQARRMR